MTEICRQLVSEGSAERWFCLVCEGSFTSYDYEITSAQSQLVAHMLDNHAKREDLNFIRRVTYEGVP